MIDKQEAMDVLECYRRNMAHILGEDDEKVKVIETCENLVAEAEDSLIRCKDCQWKEDKKCGRFADVMIFDDDFCSRGKRREDE